MEEEETWEKISYLQKIPVSPVWIVEYAWAHKMRDILKTADPTFLPDMGQQQPLSLEEPWRLRIGSAQAYTLVKKREIGAFENVVSFLEATYRILPRLVTPIKHMKIMFGLKTMVIMWMFKEGHGVIPIVVKLLQLFPSNLPQYQGQCSQQVMSLMKKNHRDFKALAQSLAVNKDKLNYYIKNQMEEEYGERYAQKLEERLLHYLDELEAVLPKDTFIDKIFKKNGPVAEEESLLLRVLACDSRPIETSLKRLLQASAAACPHEARPAPSASQGGASRAPAFPATSPTAAPLEEEEEEQTMGTEDSPLLLEDEEVVEEAREREAAVRGEAGRKEVRDDDDDDDDDDGGEEEENSLASEEYVSSPQFCAKHQRWVRSILQECSEEAPPHASSSSSSSQDLTPSLLVPAPPAHSAPHPMTSPASGGDASPVPPLTRLPPFATDPSPIPALSLGDGGNVVAPHRISPPPASKSPSATPTPPRPLAPPTALCPAPVALPEPPPGPQATHPPTAVYRLRPTCQPYSRLSRRFRRPAAALKSTAPSPSSPSSPEGSAAASTGTQSRTPPLPTHSELFSRSTRDAGSGTRSAALSVNTPQRRSPTRPSVDQVVRPPSASAPHPAAVSPPQCAPRPEERAPLIPSLIPAVIQTPGSPPGQRGTLQPHVRLTRLSQRELGSLRGKRPPAAEEDERDTDDEGEEDVYLSFDLNALYSSDDSSEHSENTDPDYLP